MVTQLVERSPNSLELSFEPPARLRRRRLASAALAALLLLPVGALAADIDRDAAAALDEAEALAKKAQGLHDDPVRWECALIEAMSAVKRADALLGAGQGTDRLRRRAVVVRAAIEEADEDRRLVARLEEARSRGAEAADLYGAAFRLDDKEWDSLKPDEAADRIKRRAIREELLAALEDWAALSEKKDETERLHAIVAAADADPTSLRSRCDALIAKKDWQGLHQLAFGDEGKYIPAARLASLGWIIRAEGGAEAAVSFLKEANRRHPSDYWIAFELAAACRTSKPPAAAEAIRYFTVAAALRPDSAAAHANLGQALRDAQRWDEAIAELRKAVELKPDDAAAHDRLGVVLIELGRLEEAIAEFRNAVQLQPSSASAHEHMGKALRFIGRREEAGAELRKAIELQPDDASAHNQLGLLLEEQGDAEGAVAEFRKAIALRPDAAEFYTNLGAVLASRGQPDEAIAALRRAIQLRPDSADAHDNLGTLLTQQHAYEEAVVEFRRAVELQPQSADAHSSFGHALRRMGRWDEAIAEYRKALELRPDDPLCHCNLGQALLQKGQFTEALAALRRGHELGSKQPGWRYPSAQWVQDAERLAALDAKLPAVLNGEARPADAAEQLELARVCQIKRLYAASARFSADAFSADPKRADDLLSGSRYHAACAAALAGCGKGEDAARLEDKERAQLRQQSRTWLQAELATWSQRIDAGSGVERMAAAQALQRWTKEADLAGVRDVDALAKLPAEEQDAWRKLWADADALRKRAEAK
ncbi:MAG TPA: tetratricopeptide repeat protein [Gemmataceae bacterium]|nr:tetratricopeptide repeat protein [Gemmataceae bacterium]